MTLRHLQIFRTVCSSMSVTRAAEMMNMTQPAVSIAIREMETYYRTRLFDRIGRRIYLTEAGRALLRYAEGILEQMEEASAVLRDEGNFHRCRIGANVTVGETMLPEMLRTIRAEIPDVQLEVYVCSAQAVEGKLDDNSIDFAVMDGMSQRWSRSAQHFAEEVMWVVCAPGYRTDVRIGMKELAEESLLLRGPGSGNRTCVDAELARQKLKVNAVVESVSDLCLIRMAEAGLGIAILPQGVVAPMVEAGSLIRLELTDGSFVRQYALVSSDRKYQTATVRRVMELILGKRELSKDGT